MKTLAEELEEHPFFAELPTEYIEIIAGCGQNVVFKPGVVIAEEGSAARSAHGEWHLRRGQSGLQRGETADVESDVTIPSAVAGSTGDRVWIRQLQQMYFLIGYLQPGTGITQIRA